MSTLPKPPATLREFEYVSDDDVARMRVRMQQHLGAASMHAFGHVADTVRVLCERSLLPPLTVLEELLAKISPKARVPDIIARVRSLSTPLSSSQLSFHQAVRLHLIKTLPLWPACPQLQSPSEDAVPPVDAADVPTNDAADEFRRQPAVSQVPQSHLSASTARNPNKRPRAAETAVSEPVSATKRITLAPPIILLPPNLGSTVLNIANGPKFFQEGVLVVGGNDDRLGSTASALTSATESIVSFNGDEYVLKEMSSCTVNEWRQRVVAVVAQGNTWQFKDFHSKDPTQIFAMVKGFYLQFSESQCDACVSAWNVQVIRVSRCSRHLDRAAQRQMWEGIADQARRRRLI